MSTSIVLAVQFFMVRDVPDISRKFSIIKVVSQFDRRCQLDRSSQEWWILVTREAMTLYSQWCSKPGQCPGIKPLCREFVLPSKSAAQSNKGVSWIHCYSNHDCNKTWSVGVFNQMLGVNCVIHLALLQLTS